MAIIAFIEAEDVIEKILKHLGLWDIKPRPPPGITKSSPSFTEPHIDYSDSQILYSDNGLYHLTFIYNGRYVFEVEKWIAPPFLSQTTL